MDLKDIEKAVLEFVEKLLDDASLWFWLGVALIVLLIADAKQYFSLVKVFTEPKATALAAVVLLAALWLNALSLHAPLARLISVLKKRLIDAQNRLRRQRLAERVPSDAGEKLIEVTHIPCLERRWVIWFVYLVQDKWKLLLHETVQLDKEFDGARSLMRLGLLTRTGDDPSSMYAARSHTW